MYRTALLILMLLATAAPAQTVIDRLSGTFGQLTGDRTCGANPHRVTFGPDRKRLVFRWRHPYQSSVSGIVHDELGYEVIGFDGASVAMVMDNEPRRTAKGAVVTWLMRPIVNPDGYCWGRTDWPAERCVFAAVRCLYGVGA